MNRIPEEQAFWQSSLDWLRENFGSIESFRSQTLLAPGLSVRVLFVVRWRCL